MENKILIVGFGVVGQVIYNSLSDQFTADLCDPKLENFDQNVDIDWENINDKYSTIFLCVPTSTGKDVRSEYTPIIVQEYLEACVRHKFKGIVIIKSTILYKDIEKFTEILKLAYWAEFLNDLTAETDYIDDVRPLVGCPTFIVNDMNEIFKTHFSHISAPHYDTLENAINFKFIRNAYISWKISFWNIIAQHKIMDQRSITHLLDQRPVPECTAIAIDGLLGFGGKCLPKDFQALNSVLNEKIFNDTITWNKNLRDPNPPKFMGANKGGGMKGDF